MAIQSNAIGRVYYLQALQDLEDLLNAVDQLAQDENVQRAYDNLDDNVKQGRDLTRLAADEIADLFIALTANCKNEDVPYEFYRQLRNAVDDQQLTEQQAQEEVAQRHSSLHSTGTAEFNEMPHFVNLLLNNLELHSARTIADAWEQTLVNIRNIALDENALATFHVYQQLEQSYSTSINRILREKSRDHAPSRQPAEPFSPDEEEAPESAYTEEDGNDAGMDDLPDPQDVPEVLKKELQEKQQQQQQVAWLQELKKKYQECIDHVNMHLRELGEDVAHNSELAKIKDLVENLPMSEEAQQKADTELSKLEGLSAQHPEYDKIMDYLRRLTSWPWDESSEISTDLSKTREILDEDHYGLETVKEQVLEEVAVQARTEHGQPQIVCLVGPPGVGKTSIAKSLARAMNREFVKMALGGITDESNIRGHNRTYVGSKPGWIVDNMIKAGTNNPLFLFDEIDKIPTGGGNYGAPESAMLEVLDPEQNDQFHDKFMEVGLDLSQVMFVTTANHPEDIPAALKDRMHVIDIGAYVTEEKLEIAKQYLVTKAQEASGVGNSGLEITEDALRNLITSYSPEAGVRKLERNIKKICRKHAKDINEGKVGEDDTVEVTPDNLTEYVGPPVFTHEKKEEAALSGVVNGLAASDLGGTVLEIKTVNKGAGKDDEFHINAQAQGSLGEMMQNSVKAAEAYITSNCDELGLDEEDLRKLNLYAQVIDQGTGVEGPSAGAALTTAIVSAAVAEVEDYNVRSDIAMTGTVEVKGKVGKIGGLRQKLDAARNDPNISTVLIPKDNEADLQEVPETIKNALNIYPVSNIQEVLSHALVNYNPWATNDNTPDSGPQCSPAPSSGGGSNSNTGTGGGQQASLSCTANAASFTTATETEAQARPHDKQLQLRPMRYSLG